MTPFTKQNLECHSGYITFVAADGTRSFVARFKGNVARRSAGPFMTFLRRNFTVEEYFTRREAGETPLHIVQSKGFIMSHVKSWMRRDGFPVTPEGYKQWFAAYRAKLDARTAAQS